MKQILPLLAGLTVAVTSAAGALAQQGQPRTAGGMVLGAVKKVDLAGRKLIVTPFAGGASDRIVQVPAEVAIRRMVSAKATDLKVGDSISVNGQPLVLNATQIRIGDEPATRPQASSGQRGRIQTASRRDRAGAGPRHYGTVRRVTPLVVALPDGLTFEVRTSAKTRFTRAAKISLGDIKVGEPILAVGAARPDGSVQARRVQIGLEATPFTRSPRR